MSKINKQGLECRQLVLSSKFIFSFFLSHSLPQACRAWLINISLLAKCTERTQILSSQTLIKLEMHDNHFHREVEKVAKQATTFQIAPKFPEIFKMYPSSQKHYKKSDLIDLLNKPKVSSWISFKYT